MTRRLALAAVLAASLSQAAGAGAATLTADQACYTEKAPMTLTGAGFGAGDQIFVQGNQVFESGAAGSDGGFRVTTSAPLLGTINPGTKSFVITATDQATQVSAPVTVRVATFTFSTSLGFASATAQRTWKFSGLFQKPGKPIYGHFRFKGKTYSNHRFGVPKGPCGTLTARAPLIPGATPRPGTWTVQIDFAKTYKATTKPRLRNTATVIRTFG